MRVHGNEALLMKNWLIKLLGGYTEPPPLPAEIKATIEIAKSKEIERLTDAVRDLTEQQRKIANRRYPGGVYWTSAHSLTFILDEKNPNR